MNTDSYILIAFNTLKNNTATIGAVEYECIFDNGTYRDKKAFGFEAADDCLITVRSSELSADARHFLKQLVTINGEVWEIIATKSGSATTQFTLSSPNKL